MTISRAWELAYEKRKEDTKGGNITMNGDTEGRERIARGGRSELA